MKANVYSRVWLGILLSLMVTGTAGAWDLTGKEKINEFQKIVSEQDAEIFRLKGDLEKRDSLITGLQTEIDNLKQSEASLQSEILQTKTLLSDADAKAEKCEQKLAVEMKRGTGIKVIFFKGDIIYEVMNEAFVDYKAGLRYRSISDSVFRDVLSRFEQGAGGDHELLAAMQEMDMSGDRIVDMKEAVAFRKKYDGSLGQPSSPLQGSL